MITLHLTDIDYPGQRLAIQQGATYQAPAIILSNVDLTGYELRAHLRDNYLARGGTLLASFDFPGRSLEMRAVGDSLIAVPVTTIFMALSAEQTGQLDASSLIPRTSAATPFQPGINCWVWDLEAHEENVAADLKKVYRIAGGFAQLSEEVTE